MRSKKGVYLYLLNKTNLDMSNIDSNFEWFISSFCLNSSNLNRDVNEFIKASEFKRVASSSRNINSGGYRQLMKLSVDRGYATDNGMNPSHSKYAIRFNSSSTTARLFDRELLENNLFFDNLARVTSIELIFHTGEFEADFENRIIHTTYWQGVHRAFILYEDTGEFKADFLPCHLDKQSFVLMIRKWVCVYEILKYGWNDIQLLDPLRHQNYNDCFKSILKCFCEIYWSARHENQINRPQTQRKALDNIKNTSVNRKDVDKLRHGLDWKRDDDAGRYAAMNWLKKAVVQNTNTNVISALQQLEIIQKEQEEAVYTKVGRQERRKN
jgi:hypothetical protein